MLLIQNLSNAPKIATRKLIIERTWWKIVEKNRRKRGRIAKQKTNGEGGVIGMSDVTNRSRKLFV